MIYTLTVNPAIDYVIAIDSFVEGQINKTKAADIYAGGKGINVSQVLREFDVENVALGFTAGPTGEMLESMLTSGGVDTSLIHVSGGATRINVKINAGVETEINGQGPDITAEDISKLYDRLGTLSAKDMLIMSGSVPKCVGDDLYADLCKFALDKGTKTVVDATKNLLTATLNYHPFLIKPNHHELGEMFGVDIDTYDDAIEYAARLKEAGAINVMVSMGAKGAVLLDEYGKSHICEAPAGKVVNSVGAGDTTVAAFVAEYLRQTTDAKVDYEAILHFAVKAGSATAFKSGLITKGDIINFEP